MTDDYMLIEMIVHDDCHSLIVQLLQKKTWVCSYMQRDNELTDDLRTRRINHLFFNHLKPYNTIKGFRM